MQKLDAIEWAGVGAGVVGSFCVSNAIFLIGYPLFTLSSIILLITAVLQKNMRLKVLQLVFLCANINGLITFWRF